MNYLSAENIAKSFGDRWLFKNISFGISKGDKVALIGTNGTGKTTFLNILTGKIPADEGEVSIRKDIRVGYLDQSPAFDESLPVLEVIFSSNNPVAQVVKRYEHAIENDLHDELAEVMEDMDKLNAWDFEYRTKEVLGRLGIHHTDNAYGTLSGGQRKRVALAKVLLEDPDLLILDEPTNHLDLDTVEWLEEYLNTSNTTLLVVTHDRYFLDTVCNQMLELDHGSAYTYKGNYSYFLEKKAEREELEAATIDKARNLMRKELEWIRRQPKARGTKAKYRIDAFEDLKEKASQKKFDVQMELNVRTSRLGSKIIELENISKGFGERQLIKNFEYTFRRGDRIGVVGKNGMGKSTLLNMITGELQPDKGKISTGETVQFGYYKQTDLVFNENQRVIDIVKDVAEVVQLGTGETVTVGVLLQAFLFSPSKQYDFISKLSGGERRRLQLLLILIKQPNFLILDEPTNDLDIDSLNVLEEFLLNFPGCLMIVSHDRYFLDRLVQHIFVFEGDGKISDFPGNYTELRDYQDEQEAEKKLAATNAPKPAAPVVLAPREPVAATPAATAKRKLSYKEQKEMEQLEADIAKMEVTKTQLVENLNKGGSHEDLAKWSKQIEEINDSQAEKEMRWLELSENA
ncbi:ATP-binding cassette subfamily F protein uup [Dyadobacter sp. BE34]|uniref:ATP-binding cassette subfamily F protein uup n=1 Tax=Dyadobacter fermentans TaxID=94254 RepID=A0ABU1QPC1_9BACT|nr:MULTISPECIES: ABC-F family ATP-binding cassette domain-containing protein [Dyadobacter]MDR6802996.1 ATP-binding cassette subfamily F protein uup [Dyadobacter fermentans]MDR7040738.1 ATP-binding cassette subfamily F protein uup [Dyadobacter sp. BE242]MDR7195140.1 ATP-binding cassette subfamily F protein uup [Dyadobacter sp. BE34]MDR7214315.1 ATP-binding cassette subfamily F protein uup [Dyadobacter sp. BE31]MDR7260548.1 ATP-binding cassette subfamily F protein uup [Dyadobacter sp. BE32]